MARNKAINPVKELAKKSPVAGMIEVHRQKCHSIGNEIAENTAICDGVPRIPAIRSIGVPYPET